MQITMNVPLKKFDQFHQILIDVKGHYVWNPYIIGSDKVRVCFSVQNSNSFYEQWNRCTTQTREKKSSKLDILKRKIKGLFI